jgi:hypothetical protein
LPTSSDGFSIFDRVFYFLSSLLRIISNIELHFMAFINAERRIVAPGRIRVILHEQPSSLTVGSRILG